MLQEKSVLVSGGTGSFGHTFVPMTLARYNPKTVIISSRGEMKHSDMDKLFCGVHQGQQPRVDEPVRAAAMDGREQDGEELRVMP